MHRFVLLALAATAACVPSVTKREIDSSTPGIPDLVAGNDAFAFDMEHLIAAEGGNAFFSPFSMSGALAMTYAGAAGDTATQMRDALHVGLSDEDFHPLFGALMKDLDQDKRAPYQLDIANRLFGQNGFDWNADFVELTDTDYLAPMEAVEFGADPNGARTHINDWVAGETHDRIKDLFAPGTITSDTALVLANAIYFKGSWEYAFDPAETKPVPFTLLSGDAVQVPMMSIFGQALAHTTIEGARIVELPYRGGDLAMDLIVPDDPAGLLAVEAALNGDTYRAAIDQLSPSEVTVRMPKVELTWTRSLGADLQALGMTDAFDPSLADFSGMMDGAALSIDVVVHKAFVSIDEEGTEAAAATGVAATTVSVSPEPIVIMADRPYLFVIRDLLTGSVLFIGRIEDPS